MKETPFKHKVEKLLDDHNAWYIKYWAGSKFTKEGIPDILACVRGKFYGIELKGDDGRPALLQLIKLRDIRNAGGIGILLYPEDYKYFEALIKGNELGEYWYRENKQKQSEWFNKLMS